MARKALIEKEKKRERLVTKYAELRAQLKAQGDYELLMKLPRNASPTRLRNRCSLSGRSRGYIRRFGLSRIEFRQKALAGELPGVKKISW
jgi:small subunit ribosomal protein S14